MTRPTDLSSEQFQQRCLDGCARILGPALRFERVHGRAADYWLARGSCGGVELQIFIYEDGAEFGVAGRRDMNVYEWPDFRGLTKLADKFLEELQSAVARR